MNIIILILVVTIVFTLTVWRARRRHYKRLPMYERLWEDYIRTKGKEPALSAAKKKLSGYVCEMLKTARSYEHLFQLKNELSIYERNRPFELSILYEQFRTDEIRKCLVEKEAEFAKQQEEADKLDKKKRDDLEAQWLLEAEHAKTLDEAATVLVGNHWISPSRTLAIQKCNNFSLKEVLTASTLEELQLAGTRAREGSLAKKFVPFMHEKIARNAVENADTTEKIIAAGELVPEAALQKDTALYVAFVKLQRQLRAH